MEGRDLPGWDAFEEEIEQLRSLWSAPLLFRGQSNSEWSLATTLERQGGCEGMSFETYHRLILRASPAVETFTGARWDMPSIGDVRSMCRDLVLGFDSFPPLPIPQCMVYLRHHGFPSPLLDWSYSPNVAAFFAFRDPPNKDEKPRMRSIYVFCEKPAGSKTWGSGLARIRSVGSYVRSDPRHFRQQSDYTICGNFDESWHFRPHDEVFNTKRIGQDFLWKFNLPSTERTKVLQLLNGYNLNAFSLLDSVETLLETIWLQEAVLKPLPLGLG
jgi:FRG domain